MAKRKKTRTHVKTDDKSNDAPKSFVIKSGTVGRSAAALVRDVRKVMEPNTASRLKERKSNKLRDFLTMAGPLGVSHMLVFNRTEVGINMRIARAPRGPTLTFRVVKYALVRDIIASMRRPRSPGQEFVTPPLLVLNNFASPEKHLQLLATTMQNLFPPIHVQTMHLTQARRVVLLNYNSSTRTIDFRHYLISVRPVGVSRNIRRVVEGTSSRSASVNRDQRRSGSKNLVNLGSAADIAEYVLGRGGTGVARGGPESGMDTDMSEAESEAEDANDPKMAVELAQDYVGRGNARDEKRAVRLQEIGPRMELRLVKIEEGLGGGEVLYHDIVKKTPAEALALSRSAAAKKRLKAERKAEQAANVARKKAEKEALKTSKRGKRAEGEDRTSDAVAREEEESDAGEDEGEDEFEYEDQFGRPEEEEEEEDGDETGAFGLDEELLSDGEEEEQESEEEDEKADEEGSDSDSDLSPVEVGKAFKRPKQASVPSSRPSTRGKLPVKRGRGGKGAVRGRSRR